MSTGRMTEAGSGDEVRIKVVIDMATRPQLGVQANGEDGRTLKIQSINDGAIKDWNEHCKPNQVVKPGDRIVSANGISGDPHKMIQACQSSKYQLKLVVEGVRYDELPLAIPSPAPPTRFSAELSKRDMPDRDRGVTSHAGHGPAWNAEGDYGVMTRIRITLEMTKGMRLGIQASPSPEGNALNIVAIQEPGIVYTWNITSPGTRKICVGDKIITANGVSGDPAAMIQQMTPQAQHTKAKKLHLLFEGVRSKRTGEPLLMPDVDQSELASLAPSLAQLPAPEYLEEKVREAAALHKQEVNAARAEHAKKLREERGEKPVNKGPGVAALVSGALKRAQEQKKEEEDKRAKEMAEEDEADDREDHDKKEREVNEREQREQREAERKKAKEDARERKARVEQAVENARKKQKVEAEADSLYTQMPEPDKNQEAATFAQARVRESPSIGGRSSGLPHEDRSKVIFLDVDGVLRPARAGGFEAVAIDGAHAVKADTSDFFKTALEALRLVIVKTGAMIVMSSEWRRDDTLKQAVDDLLTKSGIRPCGGCTTTALERDQSDSDVLRSFCERRAREISDWLSRHESTVREWVVIDDVNLAMADEHKKPGTKAMGPHLVLTVPLFGLTMGNAKTAIRVLQGEQIQKRVVSNSFPVMPTEKDEMG